MQRPDINDIAGKLPAHVSGGQKQRCACARAFVNNPKLILADEPTGALDSASAKQLCRCGRCHFYGNIPFPYDGSRPSL